MVEWRAMKPKKHVHAAAHNMKELVILMTLSLEEATKILKDADYDWEAFWCPPPPSFFGPTFTTHSSFGNKNHRV